VSFVKRGPSAAALEAEAAGLRWLADAGGVAVCPVREVTATDLVLDRVEEVRPDPAAAERFGRDLAVTHGAGAATFGAGPPGVTASFIATLDLPTSSKPSSWAEFYAEQRLRPYVRQAHDLGHDVAVVEQVCERLPELAPGIATPARLHGDLWSGNVLWSQDGAVLIDPAAHGGHPETDLAMLALFGLPHLDTVLGAYAEAAQLPRGWRRRVPLHQLHPLLVHTVLFGGGYAAQTRRAAQEALAL
jgi:fructosamine-3-kinase